MELVHLVSSRVVNSLDTLFSRSSKVLLLIDGVAVATAARGGEGEGGGGSGGEPSPLVAGGQRSFCFVTSDPIIG